MIDMRPRQSVSGPAMIGVCLAALLVACAAGASAETRMARLQGDQCVNCHRELEMLPQGLSEDDVHLQPRLSCAGCHGGDASATDEETAMSTAAGFVGVPSRSEIPGLCGRCHSNIDFMRQFQPRIPTDQVEQYRTSVHGKRLLLGDNKVADCTSCHSAHGILPASDTRSTVHALNVPNMCRKCHGDADYMKEYGIPTNQFERFSRSVHGVALLENQDTGAPACNDCHGNHGAMPPAVTSVTQVCGICHVNNMQYFSSSKMAQAWQREDYHGCEECHGNHDVAKTSDDMVGTGDKAVCVTCHSEGDEGFKAARDIRSHLSKVVGAYESAEAKRVEVERRGIEDEETDFILKDVHQQIVQARTLVHTFDPARVGEKTEAAFAKAIEAERLLNAQVREFNTRRWGFGLATLFISVLAVALYLKIRHIEGR
jgi:predicted CXXCH cytochrome family protein